MGLLIWFCVIVTEFVGTFLLFEILLLSIEDFNISLVEACLLRFFSKVGIFLYKIYIVARSTIDLSFVSLKLIFLSCFYWSVLIDTFHITLWNSIYKSNIDVKEMTDAAMKHFFVYPVKSGIWCIYKSRYNIECCPWVEQHLMERKLHNDNISLMMWC